MRSATPKVLHPLAGLPMIDHVLRAAIALNPGQIVLTLGPASEALRGLYDSRFEIAWQPEPLGTGDAVAVALPHIRPHIEWVVVIYGDHPLLDGQTLTQLLERAEREKPILAIITVELNDPGPYGRFVYEQGHIVGTVEAHEDPTVYDGTATVNSGMCCYRRDWLESHIRTLPLSAKGEYYLTGLVAQAAREEWPTHPVIGVDARPDVALGVNDRVELAEAERIMRERINRGHMLAGVSIVDPATTYIDADVRIGADSRIEPGCTLRGSTVIGERCSIGVASHLRDSTIGDDVEIVSSALEDATVGAGVRIGPYAHLRPGSVIAPGVRIGNYAEIKNASVGSGSHIHHFSYIGDARLGARVNVGAGTVVCNFDGVEKHHTEVGDDVFIGSDTMLIAPVALGHGSRTGAGSVVTRSVAAGQAVRGVPARPVSTTDDSNVGT
jgi:bifunctional UDP-N-acetylglucosamine pyrophosphorylase/glucosamine-1-phosphate N-acetyltransferase